MPRNKATTPAEQRPPSRDLRVLRQLYTFMRPYRPAVLGAVLALLIAAAAVLGFGMVLQRVVDQGLSSGSGAALNQALARFLVVVTVMAASLPAAATTSWWPSTASTPASPPSSSATPSPDGDKTHRAERRRSLHRVRRRSGPLTANGSQPIPRPTLYTPENNTAPGRSGPAAGSTGHRDSSDHQEV